MKLFPPPVIRWAVVAMAFLWIFTPPARAQATEAKYQAILIWGSNSEKSPDPKLKPVDERLAKKLKKLPFKWQHYFEVNREEFSVTAGQTRKVTMSKDCEIKVRRVDADTVEVHLFGKGHLVSKISQKLPKGECLVTGGNAADSTGWFIVLRLVD